MPTKDDLRARSILSTADDFIENHTYEQIKELANSAIHMENDPFAEENDNGSNSSGDANKKPVLLAKYSSHELHKIVNVKTCICALNSKQCPCHPPASVEDENNSSSSKKDSLSTLHEVESNESPRNSRPNSERGRSFCHLPSTVKSFRCGSATSIDERRADVTFRDWLERKKKEQREKQLAEERAKEIMVRERELALALERQNFKQWLAQKKALEERAKIEKEIRLAEAIKRQKALEIRAEANRLSYQLWLQKKKHQELERKLKKSVESQEEQSEKEKKLIENEIAYQNWLRNSKNKPKPIPLNQGLISLKSAASLTYVNPIPWVPNVENKPGTQ